MRLSTWVTGLFIIALFLPWGVFAWLTMSARDIELEKAQRTLSGLAATYAEHAAVLMALGISVPTDEDAAVPDYFDAESGGAAAMAAFRRMQTVPGISFQLHRVGDALPDEGGNVVRVNVERPDAGIAVSASQDLQLALADWQERSIAAGVALVLRTLLVSVIGVFLVLQLRWRERVQSELAAAREAAESSSRAKSEFLANMSHELRTPLNAILGFSEMIRAGMAGPLNRQYRDYGADIASSGRHLLDLINEVLDLSKLEAGHFKLHEEYVELSGIIRVAMKLLDAPAEHGKVKLQCGPIDDLPLVRVDERRLLQVLINLLSNAVKFTPPAGSVRITVSDAKGGLAIEVRDNGIGMAAHDIAKALEPFGQIESALSRKHEGTGLGLPLAKRLIELHGGTLDVVSELGEGTAVTVFLPPQRVGSRAANLVAV